MLKNVHDLVRHLRLKRINFCTFPNRQEDSFENHDIKPDILKASLDCLDDYGWTKYSLVKGALSLGLPPSIQGVFKNGGYDLLKYQAKNANQKFLNFLHSQSLSRELNENKDDDVNSTNKGCSAFIAICITKYLEMCILPILNRLPQITQLILSSNRVGQGFLNLAEISNQIAYLTLNGNVTCNNIHNKNNSINDNIDNNKISLYTDWYIDRAKIAISINYGLFILVKDFRSGRLEKYLVNDKDTSLFTHLNNSLSDDNDEKSNATINNKCNVTKASFSAEYSQQLTHSIQKFYEKIDLLTPSLNPFNRKKNHPTSSYGLRTFFEQPRTTLNMISNIIGIYR